VARRKAEQQADRARCFEDAQHGSHDCGTLAFAVLI
jgi:hypothetical protein